MTRRKGKVYDAVKHCTTISQIKAVYRDNPIAARARVGEDWKEWVLSKKVIQSGPSPDAAAAGGVVAPPVAAGPIAAAVAPDGGPGNAAIIALPDANGRMVPAYVTKEESRDDAAPPPKTARVDECFGVYTRDHSLLVHLHLHPEETLLRLYERVVDAVGDTRFRLFRFRSDVAGLDVLDPALAARGQGGGIHMLVDEKPDITYTFKVAGVPQRDVKVGFDSTVLEAVRLFEHSMIPGFVEGMQLELPDGLSLRSLPSTRQKLLRSVAITGKLAK